MKMIDKFNTIFDSYTNGQIKQARTQFRQLNKADRRDCIFYAQELGLNEISTFLINNL